MARSRAAFSELKDNWQAHWPQACDQSGLLVATLYRLQEYFAQLDQQVFARFGLQGAEFEVLATLRSVGAPYCLSPTELYRLMLVSSGGMTKILARLEDKALISRPQNPEDGRSRLVQLTGAGQAQVEACNQALLAKEHLATQWLQGDQQALSEQLQQWLNQLESRG
ncbi:MarR family winged helix-turn-helix transcriptional regulator [Gallaecimonas xiamenensis]|uniref:MarR family transcriptional regulator n=1 Tax=Gallaecimonas xiamenensis 3-C-1 TaxID=745411 RepID=K2JK94_9GAMM|nr:MarR family transcriptional regulator [Gallaecimonas xiamenensis]EKE74877.1 MarR family transcriptional regulator [Gallaecimonas xiamenensis 3-C-1]